ncbi:hypothetical protein ILUMI_10494 [Ignelater luminosus]|uniref:RNA-directed DNA polymerase n=1 Tax=Ignelater luminosus TaxID=2038154 RepID=A0A8K0D0E0_IGNLU|nr:hypothetical protein ILUMI_10494 [Ignelater luminosus]
MGSEGLNQINARIDYAQGTIELNGYLYSLKKYSPIRKENLEEWKTIIIPTNIKKGTVLIPRQQVSDTIIPETLTMTEKTSMEELDQYLQTEPEQAVEDSFEESRVQILSDVQVNLPMNKEKRKQTKPLYQVIPRSVKKDVLKFMDKHKNEDITKARFGWLFTPAWDKSMKAENIKSGFMATRIYAFNLDAIPEEAYAPSDPSVRIAEKPGDFFAHFSNNLPIVLATDASPIGVGSMLSHIMPDGSEKPIQFASQTLSSSQKKWAQIDKKAYAIIFRIKRFHQYLFEVVEKNLRNRVLSDLHNVHFGISRMLALARSFCWWPGLDADIKSVVENCTECANNKNNPSIIKHDWIYPSVPFERVHVNFAGPFLGVYFLIYGDAFLKWSEVYILNKINTENTIEVLQRIFSTFGIPNCLCTDNGVPFVNPKFASLLKELGIIHKRSAPYHPATNDQVEHSVQTIESKLKCLQANKSNLQINLNKILMQYRITI